MMFGTASGYTIRYFGAQPELYIAGELLGTEETIWSARTIRIEYPSGNEALVLAGSVERYECDHQLGWFELTWVASGDKPAAKHLP